MSVVYPADSGEPPECDPLDPEEVGVFTFDYADWLTSIGASALDESSWLASAGLVLGDGSTQVTKRGKNATPPAPQISGTRASVHAWVDSAATNSVATLTNHVQAGTQMLERSVRFRIRQL